MEDASITVCEKDGVAYLRIDGKGSFKNARYVKSFAEKMMELGVGRFVFDMQACTFMDSTFMGILAALAIQLKKTTPTLLNLVNVSAANLERLQNLGLLSLLDVTEGQIVLKADPFSTIAEANQQPSKEQIAQTMLQAHQALVEVEPKNALKFEDVITYLGEKLGVKDA